MGWGQYSPLGNVGMSKPLCSSGCLLLFELGSALNFLVYSTWSTSQGCWKGPNEKQVRDRSEVQWCSDMSGASAQGGESFPSLSGSSSCERFRKRPALLPPSFHPLLKSQEAARGKDRIGEETWFVAGPRVMLEATYSPGKLHNFPVGPHWRA